MPSLPHPHIWLQDKGHYSCIGQNHHWAKISMQESKIGVLFSLPTTIPYCKHEALLKKSSYDFFSPAITSSTDLALLSCLSCHSSWHWLSDSCTMRIYWAEVSLAYVVLTIATSLSSSLLIRDHICSYSRLRKIIFYICSQLLSPRTLWHQAYTLKCVLGKPHALTQPCGFQDIAFQEKQSLVEGRCRMEAPGAKEVSPWL